MVDVDQVRGLQVGRAHEPERTTGPSSETGVVPLAGLTSAGAPGAVVPGFDPERLRAPEVDPDLVAFLRVAQLVVRDVRDEGLAAGQPDRQAREPPERRLPFDRPSDAGLLGRHANVVGTDVRGRGGALLEVTGAGHLEGPEVHVPVDDVAVEHVGGADEAGDERGGRVVVDVGRRARLLHAALVHHDDLVGELERLLLVVRHEEAGHAELAVELVEPAPEVLAHLRVERAERLVEQQHLWPRRERPGERHALPLPSGELVGIALGEVRHLHELEQLLHAGLARLLRFLPDLEPELDVLEHGHVAEQRVVLEHEPDGPLLDALGGELDVAQPDPSRGRRLEPGDHAEHGALARARRPEQRGDRAGGGRERRRHARLRSCRTASSAPRP